MASDPQPRITVHRAAILHFLSDPGDGDAPSAYEYFDDGLLLVENGRVAAVGPASQLLDRLPPGVQAEDHRGCLIVPGFVDVHIHYPQTDVIAAGGRNLLDWLDNYTFPAERKFFDAAHGREVAEFFCDELLRNGTTTAQVYGTVHKASIDAFFEVAEARGLRMVAGKALMDRNCPEDLRDTAETAYSESSELIERWDGQGRLNYAVTPRFAVTSTDAQLAAIGRLAREHRDVRLHSHLAENTGEIAWVRELFPDARSYLDVYDRYGLVRERSIYAHCIHLDEEDRRRMANSGAAAAFCPTSNLYLGSGLFDLAACDHAGMRFALATDVGGGTSFSMLKTMGDAYKVAQMGANVLTPLRAFYLATLAGAQALGLADRIGNFVPGKEADFIVLDPNATPLMRRRAKASSELAELLRILMVLGDDRAIRQTYILGRATPTANSTL